MFYQVGKLYGKKTNVFLVKTNHFHIKYLHFVNRVAYTSRSISSFMLAWFIILGAKTLGAVV